MRDKCNLDDELNKMIINLKNEIEEHKKIVDPSILEELNEVRFNLNSVSK